MKSKVHDNITLQEELFDAKDERNIDTNDEAATDIDISEKEDVTHTEHISAETSTDVYSDLRSHDGNYIACNKKAHEAIVSVCFAKTGKRVTLSVKQLRQCIQYDKNDWLDIRYSDSTNTVLIGKSEGQYGISPISNEKKHIIYDSLTVSDFKDTLCLDFSNCSSHSAYTYKVVEIEGRPFIAVSYNDFA